MAQGLMVEDLKAHYGDRTILKGLTVEIEAGTVTAVIGPSGCGKSTFVRCLNRMHEVVPGARVEGRVLLDGQDIYAPGLDPVVVRRRIGMVFQRPNPFPTMTIYQNVSAGPRVNGFDRRRIPEVVEHGLRMAALWEEVKDRLHQPASSLSGGQQQRLCIARALALAPEVLLMDEPTSALDPISTLKIEELLWELKRAYTIVIVTHNMQQAARVADRTAFLLDGELIEYGPTTEIFTRPQDRRTEDYITGRFG